MYFLKNFHISSRVYGAILATNERPLAAVFVRSFTATGTSRWTNRYVVVEEYEANLLVTGTG
jgi:hypothetical protein